MAENKGTTRAVILAAILHLGIVGFLFLAILPCSDYENLFSLLHLPDSWNPIACERPLQLQGPIIEASIVGLTGSPPPKASHSKSAKASPPATPPSAPSAPPPTSAVIKSPLPPPPKNPDVKDQQRVVEDALQKADDAKKLQEEKEQQRQAELDAQQAQKKLEQKRKLDQLFAQMDQATAASKAAANSARQAQSLAEQAAEQQKDLQNSQDDAVPDAPVAAQRQTGANGPDAGLLAQYQAAIQNAVTPNWQRPDNMPDATCVVHIAQIPGGDVISAKVDDSCPYDEVGRRSIENAVLRTHTLPYAGFEKVFQPRLTMTFRPQ